MDPVNHFEIPFDDQERAIGFYSDVFGWKTQAIPMGEGGDYVMAYTTEIDESNDNMPKEVGVVNGGMFQRGDASVGPMVVVTVESIDETIEKVKEHGGEVLMDKRQVMEMGKYARVKDSEGNMVGLWENLKEL